MTREEYLKIRNVENIYKMKEERRIVGENFSILFENKDLIMYQIYEVLLLKNDFSDFEEELKSYQDIIPKDGELIATLYIEIADSKKRSEFLENAINLIDNIYIVSNNIKYRAISIDKEKLSCVNFIKFHVKPDRNSYIKSDNQYMSFQKTLPECLYI